MKTIKLHGSLGKKYGKTHRLDVKSPAEAVRALSVLHKGFEKDIREGFWQITTRRKGSNKRSPVSIDTVDMNVGGAHEIHFTPKPAVAGIELIIIGGLALLAVAAAVFALSAIPPAADDPNDRSQEENGFLFDGPVNVTEQGHPIPIVYGKVKTGSIVASAGLETTDFNSSTLPSYGGVGNGYGGSTGGWDRDPFTTTQIFKGGKSGGSQERSPDDQSSLNSESVARILDIIHDGEWEPALPGLQWVEFDEVPVENSDGTFNHSGVNVETTPGLPDQDYISGHGFQENTVAVDTEVSIQSGAIERSISDPDVTRARVAIRLPGLSQRDPEDGALKRVPTSGLSGQAPRIRILVQPTGTAGFAVEHDYTFRGLAAGPYVKDFNVNLPAGGAPWTIRVERMTPDSTDSLVQNGTEWNTLTSIIDAKLRYPDTALVGLTVSARQFGSKIPRRGYFIKGAKVQVPTNYNPETRVYTGEWDGTFKKAWTDNPAWVYYDLVTNERYGLGKFLKNKIDKWGLYAISQYNDVLVDDGFGGQEPRFTCNLVINKRDKAYKVLNALASSFRAISFWAHNEIQLVQDAPADPEVLIGPSNVIDGTFKYAGGIERTKKYSQFIITWNDPAEGYRQNYEVVEDTELLRQIGPKANTVAAYGCTSRGQARRMGRWLREDQKYNGGLDYTAGPDHSFVPPGKIVKVNDPDFVGQRWTGRILNSTASTTSIDLDAPVTLEAGTNYNVSVVLPDGSVETRAVTTTAGEVSTLDFAALTASPVKYAVWSLESSATVARQFRVAQVKERDVDEYEVSAGLFDPNKFARVEQNLMLEPSNYLGVPTGPILPPNSISVEEFILRDGENTVPSVLVGWEPARDARVTDYEAQVQLPGSEDFIALIGGETFNRTLEEVTQGTYTFRVRSKNGLGQTGPWRESSAFTLEGPAASLPEVQSLAYIRDNDALTTTLFWSKPSDVRPLKYEVLRASVNDFSLAVPIGLTSDQEFTVSTAGHYWVRTAYIDQRSTTPAYLQITAAELPQPDYARITNAPQTLAQLDPPGLQTLNDAISNLDSEIDDVNLDIAAANLAIDQAETDASNARDEISTQLNRLYATVPPESRDLLFDAEQTTWAYNHREKPPEEAPSPVSSEISFDTSGTKGTELVIDGANRVMWVRTPSAFDETNPRIFRMTAEFKVDRQDSVSGAAQSRFRIWAYLLNGDYQDATVTGNSVVVAQNFSEAPEADGWTRVEYTVSTGPNALSGITDFFGNDAEYTPELSKFVRFGIAGNFVGDGKTRIRAVTLSDITEAYLGEARSQVLITAEENSRIAEDSALASSISTLGSRTDTAESNITTLQNTKADSSALTTEANRIDALTSRVGTTEGGISTAQGDITSLQSTKADGTALTAEANRIDALTSRVDTTEGDISAVEGSIISLQSTKADAADLTAESQRVSEIIATLSPEGQNLHFDAAQTHWAFNHRENSPEDQASSLHSTTSILDDPVQGKQLQMDGRGTTMYSRNVLPFDKTRTRVYEFSGEFIVDRVATDGTIDSRFLALAYGLKSDYSDGGLNGETVSVVEVFSGTLDAATGWQTFTWKFSTGPSSEALAGVSDYLPDNPDFDVANIHHIRLGFRLNHNNGDGKMRTRNLRVKDVTETLENEARIVQEESARVSADSALSSSLSTLSSRTDTAESDISNLETTKADQTDLSTEASRIDALTSRVDTTEADIGTAESDISNLESTKANASDLEAEALRISQLSASVSGTVKHIVLDPNSSQNDWALSSSINSADRDLTGGFLYFDPLPSDVTVETVDGVGEIVFDGTERTFFCRDTVRFTPGRTRLYKITMQIKYDRLNSNTTSQLLLGAWYLDDDYTHAGFAGQSDPEDFVFRSASGTDWTDIEWLFAASLDPVAGFTHVIDAGTDPERIKQIRFGGQAVYNNGDGKMRLRNFAVTEITDTALQDLSGSVTTAAQVTAELQDRVQAHWSVETAVPGAEAFIRAEADLTQGGTAASSVAIGADVFSVYVPTGDEWKNALEVSGTQVRANVTLQAGAGIFVGPSNALWQVALRSEFFYETDGSAIGFGFDLGDYDVVFSTEGLDTLLAGETYVLRAINKTGTGFTADLKITTSGTPSTVTEDTNATSPAGPDHMVAKADTDIASNDVYKFYASGTIPVFGFSEGGGIYEYFGVIVARLWFHDGSSWVDGGTQSISFQSVGINPSHTSGTQNYTFTNKLIASKNWTGTIRSSSSLGCFGAEEDNGNNITNLNKVTYQKAGSSGTRSATPNGELATIQVIPK